MLTTIFPSSWKGGSAKPMYIESLSSSRPTKDISSFSPKNPKFTYWYFGGDFFYHSIYKYKRFLAQQLSHFSVQTEWFFLVLLLSPSKYSSACGKMLCVGGIQRPWVCDSPLACGVSELLLCCIFFCVIFVVAASQRPSFLSVVFLLKQY